MDRVGDRVAGWFRSGARLAFRLALPVAVAVLAVQASEGGLDALLVWTSAAADQALGWARPYFPAAVAYVEGDPGRLRVAEFAAGVVVGGAVVGVGAQLVDLVRVMAGEYVLRLRVRAEASNTFALVSGSADESADGEPRGGVGYRALTREC